MHSSYLQKLDLKCKVQKKIETKILVVYSTIPL